MLDGAVRVQETRPDHPDVRIHEWLEQRLDPAWADHLEVVVEQDEVVRGHLTEREVRLAGEAEPERGAQGVRVGEPLPPTAARAAARFRRELAVVHDEDAGAGERGPLRDGVQHVGREGALSRVRPPRPQDRP